MGQRMPDKPIVYGDNCSRWPDPSKTPKYLYVRFSGIIKCPDPNGFQYEIPPNDRFFKLTQSELHSCLWQITTTGWHVIVDLQFDPPNAIFWLEHLPDGLVYFWNTSVAPLDEGTVYHSTLPDCEDGRPAHHGIACVTWTPQATELLKAINLAKGKDLFMELFPLESGKLVYKFCRLKDATNIKILFEP